MQYPNGRYLTRSPYRNFGPGAGLELLSKSKGSELNRFVNETVTPTASVPDGYGLQGFVPCRKAGSMAALKPLVSLSGAGNLLQGGPMTGSGDISFTADPASLSMIVSMSGSGLIEITSTNPSLKLVSGMSGSGTLSITGHAGLSMIVPFSGIGTFSLTGHGNLKGFLSMSGGWTPYSTLSPESLAAAVWTSLAAQYPEAATMGGKLNLASSGGVDLEALAEAIIAKGVLTVPSFLALKDA